MKTKQKTKPMIAGIDNAEADQRFIPRGGQALPSTGKAEDVDPVAEIFKGVQFHKTTDRALAIDKVKAYIGALRHELKMDWYRRSGNNEREHGIEVQRLRTALAVAMRRHQDDIVEWSLTTQVDRDGDHK